MALIAFSLLLLLSVKSGFSAGEKVLPDGPLDVLLGKDLTINLLRPTGKDDIITWNYKGSTSIGTVRPGAVTITDQYKGRASINVTDGSLTLKSIKSEDSGDYNVVIIGLTTTIPAEVKIRVLEPVSDVMIKSDLPEAIEYNSTVVLTCTSKGSILSFTWTNDSKSIPSDDKRFTVQSSVIKLTITGVQRYDLVGPIVCTAANPLQKESSAKFNLTTYYGPEAVTIKASSQGKYVPSNSDFNLTCSASSKPAATFTWFHNAEQIEASGPVLTLKVIEEKGFGHTMGNYRCVAKNDKTQRKVPSTNVEFSVMVSETISKSLNHRNSILIAGNSSANLTCQAVRGNVTDRVWLKDGKPLSPDSHVKFSSDSTSIYIDVLKKEDNGDYYTCEASNEVTGKSTKSLPLSVTVKVKLKKIDEGLSDGAIAGIVIGCLVAVGAAIALFFYCRGKIPVSSPY
uniref:Ig-like domain-containing protein n=1 Tax=Poecilia formosa TaxID=48698 RepID=A0A087XIK9_POEFO